MIERIPSHLRSAQALYEYFHKMFPNDVYTVEIALDLQELDAKNAKRKRVRSLSLSLSLSSAYVVQVFQSLNSIKLK
jgi:hypothetical protein